MAFRTQVYYAFCGYRTYTIPVVENAVCCPSSHFIQKHITFHLLRLLLTLSLPPSLTHTHSFALVFLSSYLPQFILSMQNLTMGLALNIFGLMVYRYFSTIQYTYFFLFFLPTLPSNNFRLVSILYVLMNVCVTMYVCVFICILVSTYLKIEESIKSISFEF